LLSTNDDDDLKGDKLLLQVSGDKKSLNKIVDINFEFEEMLKYSKRDIVGMSANILMVMPIAECHDAWMISYYSTLNEKYLNKTCEIEVKDKSGYFVTFEGLCKIIPKLDNGI